jgi:hypothetical protein
VTGLLEPNLRLRVAASDDAGELSLEVVALDGQLVLRQDGHVRKNDQVPARQHEFAHRGEVWCFCLGMYINEVLWCQLDFRYIGILN